MGGFLGKPASYYKEVRRQEKDKSRELTDAERQKIAKAEDKAARGPDGTIDEADWHDY